MYTVVVNLGAGRGGVIVIGRVFQTCLPAELLSGALGLVQNHSEMRSEDQAIATPPYLLETKPQNV